jgi:hypothetical protein
MRRRRSVWRIIGLSLCLPKGIPQFGDIITNVAFGAEPFDPYSLYCYGFTGKLYRVGVGIKGRPLP